MLLSSHLNLVSERFYVTGNHLSISSGLQGHKPLTTLIVLTLGQLTLCGNEYECHRRFKQPLDLLFLLS